MFLDRFVALFAPFLCLACGVRGSMLCDACRNTALEPLPSRCYRCHKATMQFQVCASCRRSAGLGHVWVTTPYKGLGKEMVDMLKFERAAGVADEIAVIMADNLPLLADETLVCYVPTTPHRRRIRGYDQARLIARGVARKKSLDFSPLLVRIKNTRQVGSDRKTRKLQASQSYRLNERFPLKGKSVLIVDDVTTSGATIEAIAKLLKGAGAKSVDAAVFAQALDQ